MRVIAGKVRHLPLKTPQGPDTRPTTDRIKETLFNILQPEIAGTRFLDLYAGSGQIGIEALSRGASSAVFVEQAREPAECIRQNLAFTKLEPQARLIVRDAAGALRILDGEEPFDIIFMDPPYGKGLVQETLRILRQTTAASDRTLVIAEVAADEDLSWVEEEGWQLLRVKTYKTNAHAFMKLAPAALD